MNMFWSIIERNKWYSCQLLTDDDDIVCKCRVAASPEVLNIDCWYTDKKYQGQGYGGKALHKLLHYIVNEIGVPAKVQYTWNGANEYVYDWMCKHFDARCTCPLAVQKECADDDWESHIYVLDRDKFIDYFHLRRE